MKRRPEKMCSWFHVGCTASGWSCQHDLILFFSPIKSSNGENQIMSAVSPADGSTIKNPISKATVWSVDSFIRTWSAKSETGQKQHGRPNNCRQETQKGMWFCCVFMFYFFALGWWWWDDFLLVLIWIPLFCATYAENLKGRRRFQGLWSGEHVSYRKHGSVTLRSWHRYMNPKIRLGYFFFSVCWYEQLNNHLSLIHVRIFFIVFFFGKGSMKLLTRTKAQS